MDSKIDFLKNSYKKFLIQLEILKFFEELCPRTTLPATPPCIVQLDTFVILANSTVKKHKLLFYLALLFTVKLMTKKLIFVVFDQVVTGHAEKIGEFPSQ